jgi:D-xylose 1-dehydrogenase (NADP+, D-xylono-1,5-lactone-forming)
MTSQKLRWGLLSTANINRALIPPLRAAKRSILKGVASRSKEKAEAYAREWDIPKTYGSYEEMLADPEIEVIYNPLPNSLHCEWTIKACQAGKHVLCEKPLATTVEEVDAMAEAAHRVGVTVTEAFMYRHHAQTLKVKEIVDSGRLGDVRLVRGAFTFLLENPENIRMLPELGGGSIWDVGCYPISYTRYVMEAEPETVSGFQLQSPSGVDIFFTGQMLFAGNRMAQFDSSFSAAPRAYIEIVGKEASLSIPNPYKPGRRESLLLSHGNGQEKIAVRGGELYLGEVEDIESAALDGKPPLISLAHTRANVETILALLRSAKEGRSVSLKGM